MFADLPPDDGVGWGPDEPSDRLWSAGRRAAGVLVPAGPSVETLRIEARRRRRSRRLLGSAASLVVLIAGAAGMVALEPIEQVQVVTAADNDLPMTDQAPEAGDGQDENRAGQESDVQPLAELEPLEIEQADLQADGEESGSSGPGDGEPAAPEPGDDEANSSPSTSVASADPDPNGSGQGDISPDVGEPIDGESSDPEGAQPIVEPGDDANVAPEPGGGNDCSTSSGGGTTGGIGSGDSQSTIEYYMMSDREGYDVTITVARGDDARSQAASAMRTASEVWSVDDQTVWVRRGSRTRTSTVLDSSVFVSAESAGDINFLMSVVVNPAAFGVPVEEGHAGSQNGGSQNGSNPSCSG